MNSILLVHRNRPRHLELCIRALDEATYPRSKAVELLVMDCSEEPTDIDAKHLLIRYYDDPQPANSLLHKSALLNDLAAEAKGDLLTVIDVDVLCTPDFLTNIEAFYADAENRQNKLGHRVHLMDVHTSKRFTSDAVGGGYDYLARMLAMNHRFPIAAETHYDILTGCGLFTMPTKLFRDLGGYCEDFIGYGWEDIEFNQRAHKNGIQTEINTTAPLYHLHHPKGGWGDPEAELRNRQLFISKQRQGFPIPPQRDVVESEQKAPCGCFRSKG